MALIRRRNRFLAPLLLALPPLNTSLTAPIQKRIRSKPHVTLTSVKNVSDRGRDHDIDVMSIRDPNTNGKPSVSITGLPESLPSIDRTLSIASVIDLILSFLVSDIGSISLGLIGLFVCVCNRLSSMNWDNSLLESGAANAMGVQSRTDLLAVIASGSVLLHGVSKLDVTSALAPSVIMEGVRLGHPMLVETSPLIDSKDLNTESLRKVFWAMDSFLALVQTAILLGHDGDQWHLLVLSGIVPTNPVMKISPSTPILDKFFKSTKETYLPTLQALPGKAEFTYLPPNAQEVLLLGVPLSHDDESNRKQITLVAVLASDTAKSLTPRDVAWCQLVANRLGTDLKSMVFSSETQPNG